MNVLSRLFRTAADETPDAFPLHSAGNIVEPSRETFATYRESIAHARQCESTNPIPIRYTWQRRVVINELLIAAEQENAGIGILTSTADVLPLDVEAVDRLRGLQHKHVTAILWGPDAMKSLWYRELRRFPAADIRFVPDVDPTFMFHQFMYTEHAYLNTATIPFRYPEGVPDELDARVCFEDVNGVTRLRKCMGALLQPQKLLFKTIEDSL